MRQIIVRFLGLHELYLTAEDQKKTILEQLERYTSFNDSLLRQAYETIQKPALSHETSEAFVEALLLIENSIPWIVMEPFINDEPVQLGELQTKVAQYSLLEDVSIGNLIRQSKHSAICMAIYFFEMAESNVFLYQNAEQCLLGCDETHARILRAIAQILFHHAFAKEFCSPPFAKCAILECKELYNVYQWYRNCDELFNYVSVKIHEIEKFGKEVQLFDGHCGWEAEEIDFTDIINVSGCFELDYAYEPLISKEYILTDVNLDVLKQDLLKSKDFALLCLKTEQLAVIAREETENLLAMARSSDFGEAQELFIRYPGFDFERIYDDNCRQVQEMLVQYGGLREALASSMEISGVTEILSDIEDVQQMLTSTQLRQTQCSNDLIRQEFNTVFRELPNTCRERREKIESYHAQLQELTRRLHLSVYVKEGELEQLIYDSKIDILSVYDSSLSDIVAELINFAAARHQQSEQELEILQKKISILKGCELNYTYRTKSISFQQLEQIMQGQLYIARQNFVLRRQYERNSARFEHLKTNLELEQLI